MHSASVVQSLPQLDGSTHCTHFDGISEPVWRLLGADVVNLSCVGSAEMVSCCPPPPPLDAAVEAPPLELVPDELLLEPPQPASASRAVAPKMLSHFMARGETLFFVDGALVGSVSERLEPRRFVVGGPGTPQGVSAKHRRYPLTVSRGDQALSPTPSPPPWRPRPRDRPRPIP